MEYRIGALLSGKGGGDNTVLGHIGKKVGLVKESFDDKAVTVTVPVPASVPASAPASVPAPTQEQAQMSPLTQITALAVILFAVELVVYILLGSVAAYLSWTSNSSIGWHPAMCVIFSILAFCFGATYITGHILFKLDLLQALGLGKAFAQGRVNSGRHRQTQAPAWGRGPPPSELTRAPAQ